MSATKAKSKIHARNPEKRERQSATERFAEQLQKHVEFHQGSHIDDCCFTTKALPGKLPNEKVEQLAANNLTIPQDAIASLLQRLVRHVFIG